MDQVVKGGQDWWCRAAYTPDSRIACTGLTSFLIMPIRARTAGQSHFWIPESQTK